MKVALRLGFILLAVLSLFPVTRFAADAWGQWQCGIHPFSLIILAAFSALVITVAMAGIRWTLPQNRRFGYLAFIAPWVALAAFLTWLFWLSPPCPFLSR